MLNAGVLLMNKIQAIQYVTTGIIFDRLYMKNIREASNYVHGTVLDIGCGTKPYKKYFRCKQYIGVEIAETEIKNSKHDVLYDGVNLPFNDSSFDTVLCFEVIEHVKEPHKFIREMARVLKNRGTLILSSPQDIFPHGIPNDYYRYTKYGLEFLAKDAGLEPVKYLKTTGSFGTVGFLLVNAIFNITGNRKTFLNYAIKGVLLILCLATQLIFSFLDSVSGYKGNTVDNMIIAAKN